MSGDRRKWRGGEKRVDRQDFQQPGGWDFRVLHISHNGEQLQMLKSYCSFPRLLKVQLIWSLQDRELCTALPTGCTM